MLLEQIIDKSNNAIIQISFNLKKIFVEFYFISFFCKEKKYIYVKKEIESSLRRIFVGEEVLSKY